LLGEREVTP
jgi:hypothetical protein